MISIEIPNNELKMFLDSLNNALFLYEHDYNARILGCESNYIIADKVPRNVQHERLEYLKIFYNKVAAIEKNVNVRI